MYIVHKYAFVGGNEYPISYILFVFLSDGNTFKSSIVNKQNR